MQKRLNIGIIGGGIGGTAAAVALRHFGSDATIYERADKLREAGVGMMFWQNATRVFQELGLLDEIISLGGESTHFFVRAQNGNIMMRLGHNDFDVPAICLQRKEILKTLVSALPPEVIKLGQNFQRLEQKQDKVIVHFEDGSSHEHDVVIGADGVYSKVRKELFGKIDPRFHGYIIWRGVAEYDGSAIPEGSNSETWGIGQRFGILNTGHGRFTWYATKNLAQNHADSPFGRRIELQKAFADWHEPVFELISNTAEEDILKRPALDLAPLRHWAKGRAALLGDSAHPCTPNLGQGGGMAIEDALVLAKCLHRETSVVNALRQYELRRISRTKHIQQRSRLMGQIGQWETNLFVNARRIVTQILPAAIFEYNLRKTFSYRT